MKKRKASAKGFEMKLTYSGKILSYKRLTAYIRSHEEHSSDNEWGSHEILSLFHEAALGAKLLIANRFGERVKSHEEIAEQLSRIDVHLENLYNRLKRIARLVRYEHLTPLISGKNYHEEFLKTYEEFMKRISG